MRVNDRRIGGDEGVLAVADAGRVDMESLLRLNKGTNAMLVGGYGQG